MGNVMYLAGFAIVVMTSYNSMMRQQGKVSVSIAEMRQRDKVKLQ